MKKYLTLGNAFSFSLLLLTIYSLFMGDHATAAGVGLANFGFGAGTNMGGPFGEKANNALTNMTPTEGLLMAKDCPPKGYVDVTPSLRLPQMNLPVTCIEDLIAINNYPVAKSFTVGVTSLVGSSATTKEVFIFNETNQALDNAVTDNGSGANSITYTYPDGFNGRSISRLLSNGRAGMGLVCVGVALRILINNTAAPISLAQAQGKFITRKMFTNPIVLDFDMATRQFRPDQDLSLEVVPVLWNIGPTTQFSFQLPGSAVENQKTEAAITFYLA